MLTLHEIEDSYELHFRHQVEDLSDEALCTLLVDGEALRRSMPPSLSIREAKAIVAGFLAERKGAQPEIQATAAPEQVPADAQKTAQPAAAAARRSISPYGWTLPWRMMAAALRS